MFKIDSPGATADNKFTEGNPAAAVPATVVSADWLNAVQAEVVAVIQDAGITLSKSNSAQLLAAINAKISASIPSSQPQGVRSSALNLKLSASGANASVSLTADELTVELAAGGTFRTLAGLNLSASLTASGANGLDTGTSAANTWYYAWVIWNPSGSGTAALLLSASATSPTLPAGYTYRARVGSFRTDATANKYPLSFNKFGSRTQYLIGQGNLVSLPLLASGSGGSVSAPTYVAIDTSSAVPPTASLVSLQLSATGQNTQAIVAPNPNFGGASNSFVFLNGGSAYTGQTQLFDMLLERTNVYWASTGAALRCVGYEEDV